MSAAPMHAQARLPAASAWRGSMQACMTSAGRCRGRAACVGPTARLQGSEAAPHTMPLLSFTMRQARRAHAGMRMQAVAAVRAQAQQQQQQQQPEQQQPEQHVAVSPAALQSLLGALARLGVSVPADRARPGANFRYTCAVCGGGRSGHDANCASVWFHPTGASASLKCFRSTCGYEQVVRAAGSGGGGGAAGAKRRTAPSPSWQLQRQGVVRELQPGDAARRLFDRLLVGDAAMACGVRQADGVVLGGCEGDERDGGDAQPRTYALLTTHSGGSEDAAASAAAGGAAMLALDVEAAEQFMDGYEAAVRSRPAQRHLLPAAGASVLPPNALRVVPMAPGDGGSGGAPRMGLWGAAEAAAGGSPLLDLFVVQDPMERLAMVQAGLLPHQVVSLPPHALPAFRHAVAATERASSRGAHPRRSARSYSTSPGLASEVFDYAVGPAAERLFGAFGRVVLALRGGGDAADEEGKRAAALADELARLVGPERCARLRWPAAADELHGCSAHSAYHDAWLEQLQQEQEHQQQQYVSEDDDSFSAGGAHADGSNGVDGGCEAALLSRSSAVVAAATLTAAGPDAQPLSHQHPSTLAVTRAYFPPRVGAYDMLVRDGPAALLWHARHQAVNLPLRGLYQFDAFAQEVLDLYRAARPSTVARSTGWNGLDAYYKVLPGELTIVSGIPNSGKSEWLDALAVNLAETFGWAIAFCSFEKSVKHHAVQLVEKYKGLSCLLEEGRGSGERMSREDFLDGLDFVDDHFCLIRREEDEAPGHRQRLQQQWDQQYREAAAAADAATPWQPSYLTAHDASAVQRAAEREEGGGREREAAAAPTIDWVLEKATAAVRRHGIRGLVIDPYNELDHTRPAHVTETEYISSMLSKVKAFAQRYEVHVWLVAHPKQLQDWQGKAPTLYDISGSAHFINKADAGVVIHRSWDEATDASCVQVIVQKVRNKYAGKIGQHELVYDRMTGRYEDSHSTS